MLETFQGSDLRRVMDDVRQALGESAYVVRSHVEQRGGRTVVEVLAAREDDLDVLAHRLTPPDPVYPARIDGQAEHRPLVMAFVGPTGSGKTSAMIKLALHGKIFGGARIALLSLDTYRVAALEHLQQYAEIGGLRLEAIFDEREVPDAMQRLASFDVLLVDTPGRGPRASDANASWQNALRAISPDETHLVLPVSLRADAIAGARAQMAACRPTHLLPSKADELSGDAGLVDLVARTDLPMRWISNGQAVPDDMEIASSRVLAALGLAAAEAQARTSRAA